MFFKGGRDALGFTSAIRRSPESRVGARHAFPYQRPDRSRGCGRRGTVGGPGERPGRASRRHGFESVVVALPQGARAFALGLAVRRDSLRRTPPWRRRALQWRRRSRQQPTAARNSVAPDGIDLVLETWFRSPLLQFRFSARATPGTCLAVQRPRGRDHLSARPPGIIAKLPTRRRSAGANHIGRSVK